MRRIFLVIGLLIGRLARAHDEGGCCCKPCEPVTPDNPDEPPAPPVDECPCCVRPYKPPSTDLAELAILDVDVPEYASFPIFDYVVIQDFHFITDHPLEVELHDSFCTGKYYQVYDNFQLIEDGASILNFCGISASPLVPPIKNPSFTTLSFTLDAGEHYFSVVIFDSPIGNRKTSMWITLKPLPECPGTEITVLDMKDHVLDKPVGRNVFKLTDYVAMPDVVPPASFVRPRCGGCNLS
jgi:hypothetical protein